MGIPSYLDATILIVDDQFANVRALERHLRRAGYNNVVGIIDPNMVVPTCAGIQPDLVMLDLHMPALDGYAVITMLHEARDPDDVLPILVLTADATSDALRRALEAGANDFLTKPFDAIELLLRTRNLLHIRFLHRRIRRENELLEARVHERTRALADAQLEILDRLALATEYRDDATGRHTQRVGQMSARLALELGLPASDVALIEQAAPLHDVGKVGVPDRILLKPGMLDPDELEIMRRHPAIASKILAGSRFQVLQFAEQISRTHHERWDGTGYPMGLRGEDIPLVGRIVAVADSYDAITHARPYRPALSQRAALEEMARHRGMQFDPQIVDALFQIIQGDVTVPKLSGHLSPLEDGKAHPNHRVTASL